MTSDNTALLADLTRRYAEIDVSLRVHQDQVQLHDAERRRILKEILVLRVDLGLPTMENLSYPGVSG